MRRRPDHYDFHIPCVPGRLKNWTRRIGYDRVDRLRRGIVDLVSYQLQAPLAAVSGKRIAFVSDLHYRGGEAQREVAAKLRDYLLEFRPELLLIGGDVCADSDTTGLLPEVLKPLADAVPLALAAPGNWERGKNWIPAERWRELFRSGGCDIGFNEFRTVGGFQIFCPEDPVCGNPVLPGEWLKDKVRIVLAHNPDTVIALDEPGKTAPHLALCGHTHGGQIRLPFIGSIFAASIYGCALDYGLYRRRISRSVMIVSSGTGNGSFPWRFNCRREMVLIEFL
ncbi:MAG: metallophosphoesterase [Lentisphaeria bacterium]|nr:metallophosphoesterase [Lentisphaeria bacterium]